MVCNWLKWEREGRSLAIYVDNILGKRVKGTYSQ